MLYPAKLQKSDTLILASVTSTLCASLPQTSPLHHGPAKAYPTLAIYISRKGSLPFNASLILLISQAKYFNIYLRIRNNLAAISWSSSAITQDLLQYYNSKDTKLKGTSLIYQSLVDPKSAEKNSNYGVAFSTSKTMQIFQEHFPLRNYNENVPGMALHPQQTHQNSP